MTPKQKKAAEFYANASPREARRRALRKYRVAKVRARAVIAAIQPPSMKGETE